MTAKSMLNQSHRQKKYRKQITIYLLSLIVLIIILSTVGLKFLINISIFIANFSKKDNVIQEQKKQGEPYILAPKIFNAPDATNSATISIEGSATIGKKLSILVNDEIQKEITPDEENFEVDITLEEGSNNILLVTSDKKEKIEKESRIYKIQYIKNKPTLTIESPANGATVSTEEVKINGSTASGVLVKINGLPVVVDAKGVFNYSVRLNEGENKIKIEAEDIAGNTETNELTVRYQKDE